MTASEKPRSSITRPRITYMTPIFLWSMLVIQSHHKVPHARKYVSATTVATPPKTTATNVASKIGSCSGIASQVRRPKTSFARSACSDIEVNPDRQRATARRRRRSEERRVGKSVDRGGGGRMREKRTRYA